MHSAAVSVALLVAGLAVACLTWYLVAEDEDTDLVARIEEARTRDGSAEYAQAMRHLEGNGTPRDPQRAISHLEISAQDGYAPAQYSLALLLRDGIGVKADRERAFLWLRFAAESGHPRAQYELGRMYLQGEGTARNATLGYAWLSVAAAQHVDGAEELRARARSSMSSAELQSAEAEARRFVDLRFGDR